MTRTFLAIASIALVALVVYFVVLGTGGGSHGPEPFHALTRTGGAAQMEHETERNATRPDTGGVDTLDRRPVPAVLEIEVIAAGTERPVPEAQIWMSEELLGTTNTSGKHCVDRERLLSDVLCVAAPHLLTSCADVPTHADKLVVRLGRGNTLSGRVIDGGGDPIEAAQVVVSVGGCDFLDDVSHHDGISSVAASHTKGLSYRITRSTNALGAFVVTGCPTSVLVTVQKLGFLPLLRNEDKSTAVTRHVKFSGDAHDIELTLGRVYVASVGVHCDDVRQDLASNWYGSITRHPDGLRDLTFVQGSLLLAQSKHYGICAAQWRKEYSQSHTYYRLLSRPTRNTESMQIVGGEYQIIGIDGKKVGEPVPLVYKPVQDWTPSDTVSVVAPPVPSVCGTLRARTTCGIDITQIGRTSGLPFGLSRLPTPDGLVEALLPIGDYSASPSHPLVGVPQKFTIQEGATTEIEVASPERGLLSIEITDLAGRPSTAYSVQVQMGGKSAAFARQVANGRYEISVPIGDSKILVIGADVSLRATRDVNVTAAGLHVSICPNVD